MNGCQPCNGNLDKTVWLTEHTADCQVPMLTSITFIQLQHVIWFCKFTVVSYCSGPRIYCWLKGVYWETPYSGLHIENVAGGV